MKIRALQLNLIGIQRENDVKLPETVTNKKQFLEIENVRYKIWIQAVRKLDSYNEKTERNSDKQNFVKSDKTFVIRSGSKLFVSWTPITRKRT